MAIEVVEYIVRKLTTPEVALLKTLPGLSPPTEKTND